MGSEMCIRDRTVLVPTYNVEKYLRRCLDSLLLPEVLEEIEVLVVNDGSKDGSADIARAYEKKYPQTVVFVDKENGGKSWEMFIFGKQLLVL